jgi:hypothetical protein
MMEININTHAIMMITLTISAVVFNYYSIYIYITELALKVMDSNTLVQ